MKNKPQIHLAFNKKLADYKKAGEKVPPRPIFRAGVPAFYEPSKDIPYGWLALYDDMIQDDIDRQFSQYKAIRTEILKKHGINTRYITTNLCRDFEWYKMSTDAKYKRSVEPNYIEIAKMWSKNRPSEAMEEFLKHAWGDPENIESKALKELISGAQTKRLKRKQFVVQYSSKASKANCKKDFSRYIRFNLPTVIASAVRRYKAKNK